ncbi:MAG: DUF423 domain-containing protein [Chitinophagales bacterium]|nr:DUF423 domain-containing protein [Chitinophagales bacterium]
MAVALGAFGAHGLKPHFIEEGHAWWETANRYHFYHTFAILLAGLVAQQYKLPVTAGYLFLAGVLLFSGSLYLMSLSHLLGISRSILGPITPLGGLCFLAGWACLLWWVVKTKF